MIKRLPIAISLGAGALLLASCGAQSAGGNDFPSDDMTIYVPYGAGGATDTMSRELARHFEEEWGNTVQVENRPGASGALGIQALLSEAPDGHSISVLASTAGPTNPLMHDVGYSNDDYRPVAGVIENPSVLAVGSDSELQDADSFFDYAQANPGSLQVAVNGSTSSQAMELMRLERNHDIDLSAVPFDGNAESMAALLGGNVDGVFIPNSAEVMSNIDADSFVPVAVGSPERQDYLPDVPTLVESGYEGLDDSVATFGFVVHADTPDDTVTVLESAVEDALQDEAVLEVLDPRFVPNEFVDAESFQEMLDASVEAYTPIIDEMNN